MVSTLQRYRSSLPLQIPHLLKVESDFLVKMRQEKFRKELLGVARTAGCEDDMERLIENFDRLYESNDEQGK